jgi:S-formylglutathione hydrolase FrmB
MDKAIAAGLPPMIIVMPDARTRSGGSFYVDSAADGDWEAFIARDLVEQIDRRFRTISRPGGRAIAGHSMGGYGALYLGFRHPDVFSATYALSPCCLEFTGDLTLKSPEWRTAASFNDFEAFQKPDNYLAQALAALSIAWSPDLARPPFYSDLPVTVVGGEIIPQERVAARWTSQMVVPNLERDAFRIRQLKAIGFDAGRQDQFTHIPLSLVDLDRGLSRLRISHRFEMYNGDHNSGVPDRITKVMLPFLANAIAQ